MIRSGSNRPHGAIGDSPARNMRSLAAVAIIATLLASCGPTPVPSPSPSQVSPPPSPSSSSSAPIAEQLALDECDLTGSIPCQHQAVILNQPVAGTGVSLTYSSEWAPGRKDRHGWDASSQGLGGWSLDVLQRYDPAAQVLLSGDGSWRFAKGVALSSGGRVVPSYDGTRAYVFDTAGRHVRTVDALLGTTLLTFGYDAAGRLSSAEGALDGSPIHLVVEREADGTLSGLVGFDGARTALFLDSTGQLGGLRDPAGRATVVTPTADGLVAAFYDAAGGVTTYGYDDAGRLISAKDPDGVVVTYGRTATADSVEIRATTALGRVTTYRTETSPTNRVQTYTASDMTRTTVSTDATGQHLVALPDGTKIALGAQPDPRWGTDAPIPTPVDETRPDGVTRHTTMAVSTAIVPTDPLAVSAWSQTTDVDGSAWLEKADPASRTIVWSDPAGRSIAQTYDPAGRLVRRTAPGQPDVTLAYDDHGRVATRISGSGAAAAKTTYAYGLDGVLAITGPDGLVEHVTVDSVGQIVRRTAADGSAVLSTHDAVGRLVRVAPAGQPSTTIGFSLAGRQTGFLPPTVATDGSYEARSYDQDGNVAAISLMGDRSIGIAYDAAGRVSQWQYDQGSASSEYDPATGLLTGTAAPGGIETAYSYQGRVPVTSTSSGPITGAVTDSLDQEGRVVGESINGAPPIGYTYDSAWLPTSVGDVTLQRDGITGLVSGATSGPVQTSLEYDAQGRLARIATSVRGSQVQDLRYGYDLRGRVTSVDETRAGGQPTHTTYGYDRVGRLAEITLDGKRVERDGYDAAGNRVMVETPGGKVAATYDDRDRLEAWGAATYTFRPDGQLASTTAAGATTSYTFDDFGALQSVILPDGRQVEYLVDARGARVGKKVDGRLVAGYLYGPDGALAAQLDGSGALVSQFGYDDAGRLTLVRRGSAQYQVVTDHLGSPLLVIDATTGNVAEAITYDAWGTVTSDTNPGFIPTGFAGGLRDVDTGLTQFGAREYDSLTGRWTGPDPIRYRGGDAILYRYVAGDPVNGTDPTGLKVAAGRPYDPGFEKNLSPEDPANTLPPYDPGTQRNLSPEDPTTPAGPPSEPPPPRNNVPFTCWGKCTMPDGTTCLGYCYSGEPHVQTGDRIRFGFQAAGEFQMVASPDKDLIIQARMEPYRTSTVVTLGTAVAASVAGDRVAVYASGAVPLTIAGKAETRPDFSLRLPHGGIIERHGSVVTIDWPGGSRLGVTRVGGHLDFAFVPDPTVGPTLRGLLGSADGNPANDFTTRDGTVIDPNDPAFATKLYDPFGTSWRITQAESLFDYGPGESTATFTKPDMPHGPATIDSLDAAARSKAETLCSAMGVTTEPTLTDCILDVGITGDSSYAASAAGMQESMVVAAAPLPAPAAASGSALIKDVSGTIAKPAQIDRTTFNAKAGDVVYIRARGDCISGLLWRLIGPSGPGALSLGHSCDDLGRFVLPDAGTYAIEVYTDDAKATGAYSFAIIGGPVERTASITVGQTVSDATTRIGEWHRYSFGAQAGDVVFLDATGSCVNGLLWSLVGPSGVRLSLAASCDDLGRMVLPDTGSYAVEVYADGTAAGAYSFQLRPDQ